MKKIMLLSASILFVSAVYAQKIKVYESRENIGNGNNNALVVAIYGCDESDVQKEWKSLMKGYGAKVSTDKSGMFADNAVIKDMGNNTIDIYARFDVKKDGEIDLVVGWDLGGAYMSSSAHPDKYKIAEKIMHDFSYKMTKEAIDSKLKDQQKALDKLNSQQHDLEKDNKNLNSEITDYQNRIKKDQDALEKNKDDQAKKHTEISNQQTIVDDLTKKDKAVE